MVLMLETDKEPLSQGPVLAEGKGWGGALFVVKLGRLLKNQYVG